MAGRQFENPLMALNKKKATAKFPPANDWRTTDSHEIEKRRLRAREEAFRVSNSDAVHPIFSNFRVQSGSGLHYSVEIRSVRERQFSCGGTRSGESSVARPDL